MRKEQRKEGRGPLELKQKDLSAFHALFVQSLPLDCLIVCSVSGRFPSTGTNGPLMMKDDRNTRRNANESLLRPVDPRLSVAAPKSVAAAGDKPKAPY